MIITGDNSGQVEDVVIARVIKARGTRGEVACDIETDFPERFEALEQVTVMMPDGSRLPLTLERHWFHKGRVILKFSGYDTMTAAERLRGGCLVISQADALPLDEDEFYEYEIIGAEAITAEGRNLGKVTAVMRTGGTDLLVIESEDGRELLIPFASYVEVDAKAKRITISPPEGLLQL